ncbi:MAG TPA: hypothetical protein VGL94_16375 [Ktedonobacteraceae bacterium]
MPFQKLQPILSPPLTSYWKNTSAFPALLIPLISALPGGLRIVPGPLHVSPPSLENQFHSALPPVPCWQYALIVPASLDTAHPPSWNILPDPPLKVFHVVHCELDVGSVTRCH